MAKLVLELRLEWRGLDECLASLGSAHEAAANGGVADLGFQSESDGFFWQGLKIACIEFVTSGNPILAVVKPSASIILFASWLKVALPPLASVAWVGGWPQFYCPPNEDPDPVDDPTPLVPNELAPV